jgi:hypothetical protein
MVTEIKLFESPDLGLEIRTTLSVRVLSMNGKVFERNMDTPDELLARILGTAARIEELTRTARDLRTRIAERTEEFLNIYRGM